MKPFCLIILSFLFVTTSCAQDEYVLSEEMTYHVSTDNLLHTIAFSDVFEECKYVPLKQVEEFFIGKIEQILLFDEKIIIVSDGIYCFDFDGEPVYKIANKGHAKNEYLVCETVSLSNGLLYMYDRGKRQTHVYDAQTGKFMCNIESPYAYDLYYIGDAFVIEDKYHNGDLTKTMNNRFYVYNKDFSRMQYRAFSKEQHLYNIGSLVTLGHDCVSFCDYFECKLYKMTSDKVVSYLQIDCDEPFRYTPEDIHKSIENSQFSKKGALLGLEHVCETESHLCGTFFFKSKLFNFVLDKGSGFSKVYEFAIGNSSQIWDTHSDRYSDDTYVCSFFYSDKFSNPKLKFLYDDGLPPTHPDYRNQKVLLDCKADDNPIIALYKFRRF